MYLVQRCSIYTLHTMFSSIHQSFDQINMEKSSFNMLVLLFLMLSTQCSAEQHVVGGKQGWDESTDFDTWASGQTFKVGDTLVFKYSPMHTVAELGSESEYKKCDVGSATNSMSDGNSVVKLTKAGTRYFACGTMGHCDQGMKVKITTVSASSSGSSSSSSSPSSSDATPTTTSSSGGARYTGSFVFVAVILVLNSLMHILY